MNWANTNFSVTVLSVCIGDLNRKGSISLDDINLFVSYMSNNAAWQAEFPGCNSLNGDINPLIVLMGQCTYRRPCPGPIVCP